jgi:hypothetical protein
LQKELCLGGRQYASFYFYASLDQHPSKCCGPADMLQLANLSSQSLGHMLGTDLSMRMLTRTHINYQQQTLQSLQRL